MDSLRWILIAAGALLLTGIFGYGRGWFSGLSAIWRRPAKADTVERIAPSVDAIEATADASGPAEGSPEDAKDERVAAASMPSFTNLSKVVAVRIVPDYEGAFFPAEDMVLALRAAGLRHGAYGIFHCHDEQEPERIRFSVASLVEPGSFDLSKLKESEYSGVSVFTVLPGQEDGVQLFDDMLDKAREIAKAVEGKLADEQGGALSLQRERYMREDVIEFLRRLEIALEARHEAATRAGGIEAAR